MRTIVRLTALLVLGTGTGCVSTQGLPEEYRPRAGLQAMLLPGIGYGDDLRFQIDRPAYVAVFRIVPGYGTEMLYPRPGYGSFDGHMFSGIHRVAQSPWSRSLASYGGYRVGMGAGSEPEFYLLVASERPLLLDRLGTFGYGGGTLDFRFAAMSGFAAMETLVSAVVPDLRDESWTTDYYVHWPETLHSNPGSGLVEVACSGYRVWVSPVNIAEATRALCRDRRPDRSPPPRGASPGGATPGGAIPPDSLRVIEPSRRAPVPPAERITSRQLESPAEWEAARRAAEERRVNAPAGATSEVDAGARRRGAGEDGYTPVPGGMPEMDADGRRARPDPSETGPGYRDGGERMTPSSGLPDPVAPTERVRPDPTGAPGAMPPPEARPEAPPAARPEPVAPPERARPEESRPPEPARAPDPAPEPPPARPEPVAPPERVNPEARPRPEST